MLQFIRDKLFGRLRPKTTSLESRPKQQLQANQRMHSIDSKQKQIKQKEIQSKISKKDISEGMMCDIEEVKTIKYRSYLRNQTQNLDFVSDIAQDEQLNQLYPNLMDQVHQQYPQDTDRPPTAFCSSIHANERLQQSGRSNLIKSHLISQSNKMFVRPHPSLKLIQKIKQQCSVCHLPLKISDSLQLACTHRYHRNCAIKMRSHNRYHCDICDISKDQKRTFFLLQKKSRLMKLQQKEIEDEDNL